MRAQASAHMACGRDPGNSPYKENEAVELKTRRSRKIEHSTCECFIGSSPNLNPKPGTHSPHVASLCAIMLRIDNTLKEGLGFGI